MTAHGSPERVPLEALLAHREWVRALARRLVLDENDADDVEQETWRMAVERPPRHDGSLRAWLRAVATNAARMHGRRSARRSSHEAQAVDRREAPHPEDVVAAAEMQTRLARAVLDLDEPYRSAVLYRFHEGLEAAEIAARLGVPVETVRTRVKRGIERLRERMDVELGDDRDAWCLLLVGVRAVDAGRFVPAAAGGAATAAALGGGIAMAATAKVAVAAAVLAVAGAAWWLAPKGDVAKDETAVAPPPVAAADSAATATSKRAPRTHAAVADDSPATTAAAPAPPKDGYVVHGRVVDDATGEPVANATVALCWEYARQPGKEPTATTAADGTFRCEGAVDGRFDELCLCADGYAECFIALPWRETGVFREKGDAGDVRIVLGRRVTGRVVRADGVTPAAGARLVLSKGHGGSGTMRFSHAKEFGRAGDDGRFALEHVPSAPYEPYTLIAAAEDGCGWADLPAVAGKSDVKDVEVRLRPGAAVTVTVTDAAGAPIADAKVFASPRFEPLGPPNHGQEADHNVWLPDGSASAAIFGARTDAAGVARFTKLPTGDEGRSYDFIVHAKAEAWQDHVAVEPGTEKTITIVVETPKVVRLIAAARFVDPDGRPVEGVTLTVVSGPADAKATTGPDGVAVVERRDGGPTTGVLGWFRAEKEGFAKQMVGVRLQEDNGSPLPAFTLLRPAPIDGRIVDQDGKPVAGCYVDLMRKDESQPSQTTGPDGRFSFPDATAGQWTLRHFKPKPWDEWADGNSESVVRGGDLDVAVVLRRLPVGRARIVATIVDAATGATVSADEACLFPAAQGDEPLRDADPKTDLGEGTVTFARVRPGRWRLWVRAPGHGIAVAGVDVAEGQTDVAVRVETGRTGVLRGRVDLGDTGLEMPSIVAARSMDDWTQPQWATTQADGLIGAARVQADGTFVFPKALPGRYRVWIHARGFQGEGFADVPAGGEGTAVVTFTKAGQIAFRMGGPSPTDVIEYEMSRGSEPWRTLMRLGRMKGTSHDFDATLAPGSYRWRVSYPSADFVGAPLAAGPFEGEVTVVVGETTVVDVPVVPK
jgi:RNA polymerase sigma-70 factor (ECF subfamily)